jgi:mitochondrial fission protein ELM1
MKRVAWIISEGSPGHVSQSVGLAAALAEKVPLEIRQFECRPKISGLVRHLIRLFWMGKSGRPLPGWMLDGPLGLERAKADEPAPDLIISSGGRSVFAARTLAVKYGVPFIFLGERKPYPPDWFHTVFTPSSLEKAPNDLPMDVIPTKITPEIVTQAAAEWKNRPNGMLWTMLIGGKSRSHDFQHADWEKLAEGMTALAKREGIRWLVTTSRRTGKEVEAKLRGLLPQEVVADAVWWCHQPEKKFPAYLGAAEVIWVTQDSVSMVTEAVAAGKRVVVVRPEHTPFPPTSFMPGYLANLESLGLISRLPICGMPDFDAKTSPHPEREAITTAGLAEIALTRLGWRENPSPRIP